MLISQHEREKSEPRGSCAMSSNQTASSPSSQPASSGPDIPPVAPIMVDGYGKAGGYKFDADQVDGVIKQWEDLLHDLRQDKALADQVAEVKPPGDEVASKRFVHDGAGPSGRSLQDENQKMIDYVNNYITALRAAKNKITVEEQQHQDTLKQTGI